MKFLILVFILATSVAVPAQQPSATPEEEKCDVPVFKPVEVDRKLKIKDKPVPKYTEDDIRKHSSQQVVFRALFCGSGRITNIKLLRSVSPEIDAKTLDAIRKIKFHPAEKDGAKVSTYITLEYQLNYSRITVN